MTERRPVRTRILRSRGFSLLEVVVAVAILSLTLGMLWQALGASARRATIIERTHRAVLLADSKVDEVAAIEGLSPRAESGDFEEGFRWQRRIEPVDATRGAPPAALIPYWVTVEVSWPTEASSGSGTRSVVLTTVRLGAGQ